MKIRVSFGEVMDAGLWDKFCDVTGINVWAMNEGLANRDEEYSLTEEEAKKIGIISKERG